VSKEVFPKYSLCTKHAMLQNLWLQEDLYVRPIAVHAVIIILLLLLFLLYLEFVLHVMLFHTWNMFVLFH